MKQSPFIIIGAFVIIPIAGIGVAVLLYHLIQPPKPAPPGDTNQPPAIQMPMRETQDFYYEGS